MFPYYTAKGCTAKFWLFDCYTATNPTEIAFQGRDLAGLLILATWYSYDKQLRIVEKMSDANIKKTQDTLGKIIKKPPLTEKLLKKPPFRFLHDIITSVCCELLTLFRRFLQINPFIKILLLTVYIERNTSIRCIFIKFFLPIKLK